MLKKCTSILLKVCVLYLQVAIKHLIVHRLWYDVCIGAS